MMKCRKSRGGFTLIEVLVASLLLGMLVSILTMVFNQSAIAWRTGKAGVSQLSRLRRQLSINQYTADRLLPRVDEMSKATVGMVLSPWDEKGKVRQRSVGKMGTTAYKSAGYFSSYDSAGTQTVAPWQQVTGLGGIKSGSQKTFIVGVLSYGPDGKRDTDDDITSWPENVQ